MITRDINEYGAVLIELLVTLTIAAVILTLGAQLVFVSFQSSKISGRKAVAIGLLDELFAGVDAATKQQWHGLYNLTKNSTYHPVQNSGTWSLSANTDVVTVDGIDYTRSFKVQNVCRQAGLVTGVTDSSGTATGATACTTSGGSFDPSTELVTGTLSWPDNQTFSVERYITRWPNTVCNQTGWAAAGSGVYSCPDTHYETKTNITVGNSLEICSGGC